MQAGGIQRVVTRRMLVSFDSATGGGALQEGARALAAGRHFKAKPASPRWSPTPRRNGPGCAGPAVSDVDEAFARHRQALKLAAGGQDPRPAGGLRPTSGGC